MDPATGAVLAERKAAIGIETNNVAEYQGLIAGLRAAHELGAVRVAVRMDSKLVVEQMKGTWQVKHPGLRPLAREAAQLRQSFADVTFEWIPRERNRHADRLANEAMDEAAGTPRRAAPAQPPGRSWTPPTGPRTRMLLVRHGATEHCGPMRLSGRNDLPLDAEGRQQAEALAARSFGDVAAIVSSPLRRARETADIDRCRARCPAVDQRRLRRGRFRRLRGDDLRRGTRRIPRRVRGLDRVAGGSPARRRVVRRARPPRTAWPRRDRCEAPGCRGTRRHPRVPDQDAGARRSSTRR